MTGRKEKEKERPTTKSKRKCKKKWKPKGVVVVVVVFKGISGGSGLFRKKRTPLYKSPFSSFFPSISKAKNGFISLPNASDTKFRSFLLTCVSCFVELSLSLSLSLSLIAYCLLSPTAQQQPPLANPRQSLILHFLLLSTFVLVPICVSMTLRLSHIYMYISVYLCISWICILICTTVGISMYMYVYIFVYIVNMDTFISMWVYECLRICVFIHKYV